MPSLHRSQENAGFQLIRNGFWHKFRANFLTGVLILLPLYLTYVILTRLFLVIDGILNRLATRALVSALNLPLSEDKILYGLGIFTLILIIVITGSIARNIIGKRLLSWFNLLIDRIPIIKTIYKTLRQISEALFSNKNQAFHSPVLIEYPRPGIYSLAFRTQHTSEKVDEVTGEKCLPLFLPSTPNPTTGFLLFVPVSQVHEIEMSNEEAIKLIISGGMIPPEQVIQEKPPSHLAAAANSTTMPGDGAT
ncbi:MAG: DUF502 domain-containing protein [bacterium]|nr:DUF502 domain-containing protein [bacterium]